MSIQFQGIKKRGQKFRSELQVTNELGWRMLRAMGYALPSVWECAGHMPVKDALAGIEKAKAVLPEEDHKFLDWLKELCDELKGARHKELTWF